ncbi:hypothetical protein [Streptomyces sp. NPDC001068]|uniref:hypothetical protein n=1 Tax=Streptomyces sp. NPDC001068 TaxID=3364544 RepID=UPI003693C00D
MSEQETVDRINAMLAELPSATAAQLVWQWQQDAARLAAEQLEPLPLMRGPEFPWGLRGPNATVTGWACRQPGCPMAYLEDVDELPGPMTLPVNFTADDLSAAISAQASARHQARLDRIQRAFRDHYRTDHPEALEEIHGTPTPAAR